MVALILSIIFSLNANASNSCAPKVKAAEAELKTRSAERIKFLYVEHALFSCAHQAKLSQREDVRLLLRRAVLHCEQVAATRSITDNTDCYFRAVSAAARLLKP